MNREREVALFFFQEFLLNSEESSDEDEEAIIYRNYRGPLVLRPKIANFVSHVVDFYSEAEFREHFRMYRSTFNYLLSILENKIRDVDSMGRNLVSPKEQVLVALWYYATPDSYRSICRCFNLGKATGLRTVRRVTEAIVHIASSFIIWPSGNNVQATQAAFQRIGFPSTIGVIDGSYIPIPTPKENGISYICRKNFAALILQAVCDHQMLFTHCYIGEVGSTHDSTALKRSEVFDYLTNSRNDKFPNYSHLIGDKAYPCLQTLMVPFKDNGHLTDSQKTFNYNLSKARSVIERAFALLKQRFRRLKYFDIKDIEWACKHIMACCVLHNICILQNDIINFEVTEDMEEQEEHVPVVEEVFRALHRMGMRKREYIMNTMNN